MRKPRLDRFGGFLVASAAVIGVAVAVSGLAVGQFFERHVFAHEQEHTAQVVQTQARQHLTPADFVLPPLPVDRHLFHDFLLELPGVFRIKVFDRAGRIVWSDEPRLIGLAFPDNPYLVRALRGEVVTAIDPPKGSEHLYERSRPYVIETYAPIVLPESRGIVGVIETYKDATPVVLGIRRTQRLIWGVAGAMGVILYIALAFVAWRASVSERRAMRRLEAQNRELTLIQQFTQAVLQQLDSHELARSVVERAGVGLDLSRAALYRVGDDGLIPVAHWPISAPHPQEPTLEAIEARRQVIRGAIVAFPIFTPKQTAYLFLAEFSHAVSEADLPALRVLEITLQEAGIALANVELFTEIREAHERLAAILAAIADRMVIVDREMRLVWMNAVATEALRLGEGAVGLPCFEALNEQPEMCAGCPAVRTFSSGKLERGVRAEQLPSDGMRYVDIVTTPLHDASGRVHQVLEVARDISELVEMERRLKDSAARLEKSNAALIAKTEELERTNQALREAQAQLVEKERLAAAGQVVVGLHHAILNPLTGILGALQVLRQEGTTQQKGAEALTEAEAEIRKIESLVRRLSQVRRAASVSYVGDTTMLDLARSCAQEKEA